MVIFCVSFSCLTSYEFSKPNNKYMFLWMYLSTIIFCCVTLPAVFSCSKGHFPLLLNLQHCCFKCTYLYKALKQYHPCKFLNNLFRALFSVGLFTWLYINISKENVLILTISESVTIKEVSSFINCMKSAHSPFTIRAKKAGHLSTHAPACAIYLWISKAD